MAYGIPLELSICIITSVPLNAYAFLFRLSSHLPMGCILHMRRCIQLSCLCVDFSFISLCSAASRKQEIQSGRQESSSRVMKPKQIWILWVAVRIALLVSSAHICCCSRFLTDVGAHWACRVSMDKEANPSAHAEVKFCKISWGAVGTESDRPVNICSFAARCDRR